MQIEPKQAAKLAGLKKQLEDLAGKGVDVSPEQLVQLVFPVGAQSYDDTGAVTFRRIIFPGKSCAQRRLLDASGGAFTGADGKSLFLLSSFLCADVNSFDGPINLVATPRSSTACYATAIYNLVPNPNIQGAYQDLQITVFTWEPGGKPAPNISVDWRCRLVSWQIIG